MRGFVGGLHLLLSGQQVVKVAAAAEAAYRCFWPNVALSGLLLQQEGLF